MTRIGVLVLACAPAAFAAAPAKLAFATSPGTVGTGVCSPAVTLQSQDEAGGPVNVDATLPVTLSGASAYFPPDDCSAAPIDPVEGLQIPKGGSTARFSFIAPRPGSVTLTAVAGSARPTTQVWTVVAAPGVPCAIAFKTSLASLPQNACSPPLSYELRDAMDAPATSSGRSIEVSFGPVGFVEYYSDAACAPAKRVFSRVFLPGEGNGIVYARVAAAASRVTLELDAPGLTGALLQVPIDAATEGGGCATAAGGWPALAALAILTRRRKERSSRCAS